MSSKDAPAGRDLLAAAWTGTDLLVWGGRSCQQVNAPCADGAGYNPTQDRWTALPAVGAPSPRGWPTAVWTGKELLVWGGEDPLAGTVLGNGARYNPESRTWKPMASLHAPSARRYQAAVWTGTRLLIWGGDGGATRDVALRDGAQYDPVLDRWEPLPLAGAPRGRWAHSAVWTGRELWIFGGLGCGSDFQGGPMLCGDGGRFNPGTGTWTSLPTAGAPTPRSGHSAVWTDRGMLVFGGSAGHCQDGSSGPCRDGALLDAAGARWSPLPPASAGRSGHSAAWTGTQLLVFGGELSGCGGACPVGEELTLGP